MSLSSRTELIASLSERYLKAGRAEKSRILDEVVSTCGYDRKYAITILGQPRQPKAKVKRRRSKIYGPEVAHALVRLWKLSRGLCPKRLVPFLPELVGALERHGEIAIAPGVKAKLLAMSCATAERLLAAHRRSLDRGIGTTSAGTPLRHQIPIRTFADWQDAGPGFMEIDLVAHCGDAAAGQFAYTLTMTDVFTGWTENAAMPNRGSLAVLVGMEVIMARLPFAVLGIDTDNGSEFINVVLKGYCEANSITFTRGRPYKKNDQCHVEQKNGAVVRPLVGYARYEGEEAVRDLNSLYAVHRVFLNFFMPSMKLTDKKRSGAKVKKVYDQPQTPFARLLSSGLLDKDQVASMTKGYEKLNPARISRRIEELEAGLRYHAAKIQPELETKSKQKPKLPANLFGKIHK